jgi:hypothetical protein
MDEQREEPKDDDREFVVAPDDEVPFHVPRD